MAWDQRVISTYGYPAVHNYSSALQAWSRAEVEKNAPDKRWIVKGKRDMWITHTVGHVTFQRGGTYVMWRSDDSIKISIPRNSGGNASDEAFVFAFMPNNTSIALTGNGTPYVSDLDHGGDLGWSPRSWRIGGGVITLRKVGTHWEPAVPTPPFITPELDKAKGAAALKRTGYADFVGWARAVVNLGGFKVSSLGTMREYDTERPVRPQRETPQGRAAILRMLADEGQWMALLTAPSLTNGDTKGNIALDRVSNAIRFAVYISEGCINVTEHAYVEGPKAVERWYRKALEYKPAVEAHKYGHGAHVDSGG